MLTHDLIRGRFHESSSTWLRSLSLQPIKCLIVCRGPVRKEAMDVFDRLGIREYGILLSEKDSIVYPKCFAPELRRFRFPENIHRIPDYMGAGQEEKARRIQEIVGIARDHGYTHIFAGYGFMAEDAEFIRAIEESGVRFMGPSSHVANNAGAKDQAKKLARRLRVSVTPGIDNISSLALARKVKDLSGLEKLARQHSLNVDLRGSHNLEEHAELVLDAGYGKQAELVSVEDLQSEAAIRCDELWRDNSGRRLRFKYIGGGGGKGQRVVSSPNEVRSAVMDILAESKVLASGANRNFLIELNVESTRHNEIQLIGNGSWCLSLGGRDCSVQMHEQKLVELSLTQEQLEAEIAQVRRSGERTQPATLATLEADLRTLARMEQEAERFGEAVQLDSVSTFESIVDGERNYFMEMNTRIQVEHRVTEQVYRLAFTNPDDPRETFQVDSLIEAMALLSLHGPRLPKPQRVVQHLAAGEVRLNATNRALLPHAGGIIASWSAPLVGEIRDDQGIGTPNPDTGAFVHYNLAGAYDSNIALVIAHGQSRTDVLRSLAEILRCTELRGYDLETNLQVHYGLLSWMIGQAPLVKPSTQFMSYYLAGVASVAQVARSLDLEHAWQTLCAQQKDKSARDVLELKETLLLRPLQRLLAQPHLLCGFFGRYVGQLFRRVDADAAQRYQFIGNPLDTLNALYHYLALDALGGKAAAETIWDHDQRILDRAREFYGTLGTKLGITDGDWAKQEAALAASKAPADIDAELWQRCQASHRGFQLGLQILLLPAVIAHDAELDRIRVDDKLEPTFPERLDSAKTRADLHKGFAPMPSASSDEIVTPMGGHFYAREAPHLPPLAHEGMHFSAGQPLFVIEVMKMFNKVSVPFSGTITKLLLPEDTAKIVTKGEVIFKIEPDHKRVEETAEQATERKRALTGKLLAQL